MTADEKLFDEVISGQLDVFRLSAAKRAAVLRRLKKMEKELIELLAVSPLPRNQKRKINDFLKAADEIIATGYKNIQLTLDFAGISQTISEITGTAIKAVLGLDAVKLPLADYFASVASNVLFMGRPQREYWERQEANAKAQFAGAVRQGLASAETNQQIIRRIVGLDGNGGTAQIERRNVASLVQTSVATVANDARRETFKKNSDVIKGLRQVSTLDSHTTKICMAYSGAEWDLKGKPINGNKLAYNGGTPRHFNCRSVEVPITKTLKELTGLDLPEPPTGTRASDEGQISAKTDFDSFLKRKGQAYQNKMLGEGRADLWRAGKITLSDLVSGDGRPLTLDELRRNAGLD